jgi:hypothetical protein
MKENSQRMEPGTTAANEAIGFVETLRFPERGKPYA